jgi:hypothetical protein
MNRIKISFSVDGDDFSSSVVAPESGSTRVYIFDLSGYGEPESVSVAPIFAVENREKEGPETSAAVIGKEKVAADVVGSAYLGTVYSLGEDYTFDIEEGLVAYWRFEGNAKDSSGKGNDGAIHGDIQFVDGNRGKALEDGNNGYIIINPISNELADTLKEKDFSIAFFWTPFWKGYYDPNTNWRDIVSFYHNLPSGISGHFRFEHGVDSSDKVGIWFGGTRSDNGNNAIYKNYFLDYGEENYYVAICDRTNNELRVYINGEEASSEWAITPGGENSCETKTSVWDFKFFQNNLTGEKLDEVMIYDRALSAEEIKNLYDIQKD